MNIDSLTLNNPLSKNNLSSKKDRKSKHSLTTPSFSFSNSGEKEFANKQREHYYLKKENKKLLKVYGSSIYKYSLDLDSLSAAPDPVKNHKIEKKYRTKLVDWLFEVFNVMNCQESTIYLTIHLLDYFMFKYSKKPLTNEDLHLIGVSCLFIASKYEDTIPIFMNDLKVKICHNRFSDKSLKEFERLIMDTVDFGVHLTSSADFIRTFFYEFKTSNKSIITSEDNSTIFSEIEIFSIYISKVILHSDEFSCYRNSIKAISCIVIGFEIVRTNRNFSNKLEEILKSWILSLIENSNFNPSDINLLYNKLAEYYSSFHTITSINHNLQKFTILPY